MVLVVHQLKAFSARLSWHAPLAASLCQSILHEDGSHLHHGNDESMYSSVVWNVRRTYCFPQNAFICSTGASTGAGGRFLESEIETGSLSRSTSAASTTSSRYQNQNQNQKRRRRGARNDDNAGDDDDDDDDGLELVIDTWDEDAPWRPWAAEDDPIECLELDALWTVPLYRTRSRSTGGTDDAYTYTSLESVDDRIHNVEASPVHADAWRIAALRRGYSPDDGRRPLILLQPVDQRRRFLRLQSIVHVPDDVIAGGQLKVPGNDALPGATSFYGMLSTLISTTATVIRATTDTGDLTSDAWWLSQGNYVPPVTPSYVLQDAIRDLFAATVLPVWPGSGVLGEQLPPYQLEDSLEERESEIMVGKAAPLWSLTTRLALHALRLGNPRAVAMLWSRFLRELRFAHWELGVPLPRMKKKKEKEREEVEMTTAGAAAAVPRRPEVRCCLLHQKLELLDICIEEMGKTSGGDGGTPVQEPHRLSSADEDSWGWDAWGDDVITALAPKKRAGKTRNGGKKEEENGDEGVEKQLNICLLDDPTKKINVPITQAPPPITEDAILEQIHQQNIPDNNAYNTTEEEESTNSGSTLAEQAWARSTHGALLYSDMQAFKAANKGCRFEDFIRWHSPRDWVVQGSAAGGAGGGGGAEKEKTPSNAKSNKNNDNNNNTVHGQLSVRMRHPNSRWRRLWNAAQPVPAHRQRPLFQPSLEGERALHFLETLPPAAVLSELFVLAFNGALGVLEKAEAVTALPAVAAQMARLRDLGHVWLREDGVGILLSSVDGGGEDGDGDGVVRVVSSASNIQFEEESEGDDEDDDVRRLMARFGFGNDEEDEEEEDEEEYTYSTTEQDDASEHYVDAQQEQLEQEQQTGAAEEVNASMLPAVHSILYSGLPLSRFTALVHALGCVENCVAAGQSIFLRLGGEHMNGNDGRRGAQRIANGLVHAALEQGSGCVIDRSYDGQEEEVYGCGYGAVVEMSKGGGMWAKALTCMACAGAAREQQESSTNDAQTTVGTAVPWSPKPLCTEYCIEMTTSSSHVAHRFFVRQLPAELRIATRITSE